MADAQQWYYFVELYPPFSWLFSGIGFGEWIIDLHPRKDRQECIEVKNGHVAEKFQIDEEIIVHGLQQQM